jgi:hypothetical protein
MKTKATLLLFGLFLLIIGAYYQFYITLYFLIGALWGLTNLYFIQQLLTRLLIDQSKSLLNIALLTLIKFPVLYSAGFALLYYQEEYVWAMVTGFSTVLALSMQKRFWKIFLPYEKKATMT